jgi:hypothetical protein
MKSTSEFARIRTLTELNWGKGKPGFRTTLIRSSQSRSASLKVRTFSDGNPLPTFVSRVLFDSICNLLHFTLWGAPEWGDPCVRVRELLPASRCRCPFHAGGVLTRDTNGFSVDLHSASLIFFSNAFHCGPIEIDGLQSVRASIDAMRLLFIFHGRSMRRASGTMQD